MKKLSFNAIKKLQKENGYTALQESINDGSVWKGEGNSGRYAMNTINSGICMLPKKSTYDYYGNELPSRDKLKPNTKGTFSNSQNFWQGYLNGTNDLD